MLEGIGIARFWERGRGEESTNESGRAIGSNSGSTFADGYAN